MVYTCEYILLLSSMTTSKQMPNPAVLCSVRTWHQEELWTLVINLLFPHCQELLKSLTLYWKKGSPQLSPSTRRTVPKTVEGQAVPGVTDMEIRPVETQFKVTLRQFAKHGEIYERSLFHYFFDCSHVSWLDQLQAALSSSSSTANQWTTMALEEQ